MSAGTLEIQTPVGTLEISAPTASVLEISSPSSQILEIQTPVGTLEVSTPAPLVLAVSSPGPQGATGPQGPAGAPGAPGPQGPAGDPAQTFESVAQNLNAYNVISTDYEEGVHLIKTFDSGGGTTIVVTLLFDVNGLPSTKTLSGTGLPSGIATVCTYDFTEREIPLKTYST